MSSEITQQSNEQLMTVSPGNNFLMDQSAMKHMMDVATFMSGGTLTLPEAYRKNPANCLAVVMQAAQWGMNPFAVAQKTHFVSGNIGYEAQLVAAVINGSGATKDTFNFEWYGPWEKVIGKFEIKKGDKGEYRVPGWSLKDEEGIGIKVWATLKGEDAPRILDLLLAQARTRNSTLWADDPRQQLAYLAQKRWARLYTPGVILGVYTPDEVEQLDAKEINPMPGQAKQDDVKGKVIDPAEEERRKGLITALEAFAKKGHALFLAEWKKMGKANRNDAYLVGQEEYSRLEAIALAAEAKPETTTTQAAGPQTVEHEPGADTDQTHEVEDDFVKEMNSADQPAQ